MTTISPTRRAAEKRTDTLEAFFRPRSIAIIGASRTPGKIGHEIVRNLKLSGFRDEIFPVNPKAKSVLGYKSYEKIGSIGRPVDLAVIVVPAERVEQVLQECGETDVKAVIIITSGFGEVGKTDLEKRLVEVSRSYGMRLVGPNTFGIFCAISRMNCTFGPNYILSGKTAFITQSGALGLALMSWTTEEKYGVSAIVSIGNKADVDDADLIEYFEGDESTKSILIYMEGLKDGRKFYNSSKIVAAKKPIVVIKSGRSKRGAMAVSSHTGSIAGQDRIFDVAFNEAGVLRADTMTQAFDWIQSINENPLPNGPNLVIVTNGGGIGVLATDKCEELHMDLMELPDDLKEKLRGVVPSFGSIRNPIDLTANADDELYRKVLQVLFERDDVNAIIALFCQTANIDATLVAESIIKSVGTGEKKKPITIAFVGGQMAKVAYERMLDKRFAAYPTAERSVDGMYALISRYKRSQMR
ncbi:MAG: CoA-binding protein [Thaumarchaeota archaeon]|nr:CoA-binding protein [Nitrososphaerota archaeon]